MKISREDGVGHTMRHRLLAGNWKMHGDRASLAEIEAIDAAAGHDVVLCLPASLIALAAAVVQTVTIGAQDCHAEPQGAHTGSVSAQMLADAGARWVILGHSECRSAGQGNTQIAAKVAAALPHLNIILCVGEETQGSDSGTIAAQLLASLPEMCGDALGRLVIAYEPVWAIGTGITPSPEQIGAVHARLRGALRKTFGEAGACVPILYGGSVTGDNAGAILDEPEVDGLLVGGASLSAARFAPIMAQFDK